MPELPELEVVKEVLRRRVVGQSITAVQIVASGALVVRDLTGAGMESTLTGATIENVDRRGKFLIFSIRPSGQSLLYLALNPKLTGRLQLVPLKEKRFANTHVVLSLSSGDELRYVDQRRMGQLYLTHTLDTVPGYAGMGAEPFEISLEEFRARLRTFYGEIKGILTRGAFVAGIGNAYADEILWAARIHPYRKRAQLTLEDTDRLYREMQATLRQAIQQVRREMGEAIHVKPRDFLMVHMKTGDPCPRCGTSISLVGAHQRITNFCRTCQPGGLIKGM